jgi:hypothetical protein
MSVAVPKATALPLEGFSDTPGEFRIVRGSDTTQTYSLSDEKRIPLDMRVFVPIEFDLKSANSRS